MIEAGMGFAVTLGVFGMLFGMGWVFGWFLFTASSLSATWFALAVTGLFFFRRLVFCMARRRSRRRPGAA